MGGWLRPGCSLPHAATAAIFTCSEKVGSVGEGAGGVPSFPTPRQNDWDLMGPDHSVGTTGPSLRLGLSAPMHPDQVSGIKVESPDPIAIYNASPPPFM